MTENRDYIRGGKDNPYEYLHIYIISWHYSAPTRYIISRCKIILFTCYLFLSTCNIIMHVHMQHNYVNLDINMLPCYT